MNASSNNAAEHELDLLSPIGRPATLQSLSLATSSNHSFTGIPAANRNAVSSREHLLVPPRSVNSSHDHSHSHGYLRPHRGNDSDLEASSVSMPTQTPKDKSKNPPGKLGLYVTKLWILSLVRTFFLAIFEYTTASLIAIAHRVVTDDQAPERKSEYSVISVLAANTALTHHAPTGGSGSSHRLGQVAHERCHAVIEAVQHGVNSTWLQVSVLFLILVQTAVLATTNQPFYYNGSSAAEYLYLCIFSVYTVEIICRVVSQDSVSGQIHFASSRLIWPFHGLFVSLDFVAITAFWILFIIAQSSAPWYRYHQILVALSALRILRLLRLTQATNSETTVIFTALKESRIKLAKVGSFMCFFWLLFAVIGVQTFQSSLQRYCVFPTTDAYHIGAHLDDPMQFCGGHLVNVSGQGVVTSPWILLDGSPATTHTKGYICPQGLVCRESSNPFNGTVSFDNIFQSLELVFVTFSANTFSSLMYSVIDSDGLIAAIFFIAIITILYFWLLILLIGVVVGSIQVARTKHQLQTIAEGQAPLRIPPAGKDIEERDNKHRLGRILKSLNWIWISIIACNLIVQSQQTISMSVYKIAVLNHFETTVTVILLFEIILRITADWRTFHKSKQNLTDLALALVTSAMQIPSFKKAGRVYTWFTAFQIARSYRVFWAIPPVRDVIMLSFHFFPAIVQLCSFFFLLMFLVSVIATQFFKVEGSSLEDPFTDLWTSFLAMYQVFTGEDWTASLYAITSRDTRDNIAWLGAIFIIGWFIISSIIILNMFLARIDESLNIPDDRRRFLQVTNCLRNKHKAATNIGPIPVASTSSRRSFQANNDESWLDASTITLVDEFLQSEKDRTDAIQVSILPHHSKKDIIFKDWIVPGIRKLFRRWPTLAREGERRSFFILPPYFGTAYSKIQLGCKALVIPNDTARRISAGLIFRVFIYMSIVTQVFLTCYTVPIYQREYFIQHVFQMKTWYVMTDVGFATLWAIEGLIKIIAGGLIQGDHAYLRGWNLIDAVVLITSWVNLAMIFYNVGLGQAGAFVSSFKALRVLRLLTLNKKVMREVTFVFRHGTYKVLAALLVSLSLLIPFATLGLNLFMGRAVYCNDPDILQLADCVGEYVPSSGQDLVMPRTIIQPYYSFDTFGQAFYTLFLIVSQEGWADVMHWARGVSSETSLIGNSTSTSNMNALFFIVFNFCGTIFVIALFAAVMIQNYTEATGVAFLTRNQRVWQQRLQLLRRVRPLRRPVAPAKTKSWKRWCYNRVTNDKGKWQKAVVTLFTLYLLILCIDFYPAEEHLRLFRDATIATPMLLLLANMVIRLFGLSPRFFFRRPWDLASLVLIPSGLITTIIRIWIPHNETNQVISRVVQPAILLLVIPYVRTFRDLLKIAVASIPLVSTLLITWFVFLLFFAIGLTQAFGLTRFGPHESGYVNFRTVPKALILLFRMTLGEGRTKIMEDFASIVPPYCTLGERYIEGDCGSAFLARLFFIAWKVLSTYLFTSLFISLVFDSFSYVYEDFSPRTAAISQEDIRHFKDAWAVVDPKATGYITPTSLPKFISLITGQLSLQIYDEEYAIPNLRKGCDYILPLAPGEIDIAKLNKKLSEMPVGEIQDRRRVRERYRRELLMTKDANLGISMQTALITLLYCKFLDGSDYLSFEELLRRTKRSREVDEALRKEAIARWISTYRCRRAFRKHRISVSIRF